MRIGILTVPFNNNYGGFLQAFALKRLLTGMGHEVIFINRRRDRKSTYKSRIKCLLTQLHFFKDKVKGISKFTDQFKREYLFPITEEYYTSQELKKCLKYKFDVVIVGSDQVWRYRYAKDSIDDFYCNFLEGTDIPHFSYAASMGTDEMEYPKEKVVTCSKLLKDFKKVSVREQSTVDILKKSFGINYAQVVLDPTMLLSSEDYKLLFKNIGPSIDSSYVFTYILDETEEKTAIISEVMSKRNLKRLNMKAQTGKLRAMSVIEPIEKWLSSIYYSDFVVTDSFHGAVFSIIFRKQFVVIGNPQRGMARMSDLLGRLCLESRLITKGTNIGNLINETVNWDLTNMAIRKEKAQSISFLKNALYSSFG